MNADAFLTDVLGEPDALAGMLDAYDAPGSPLHDLTGRLDGRRVVLIGMGSSGFAAHPIAARLRARGVWAVAELSSAGIPTPPGDDVVAIAISASGGTEETIEALDRHRGTSMTVAITNRPERALAEHADVVLPLHAGEETGGVSCRTFQATVALGHLLTGSHPVDLRPAVDAQSALLDARGDWLDPLLELLGDGPVYTIAPDERLASSLESALMFREGPRIPADGTETGDWLHVDVYLTKYPGYTALLFPGSRFDAGVMEWARERGSTIVTIGRGPGRGGGPAAAGGPASEPLEGVALTIPFAGAEDPVIASLVETSVAEVAAAELWRRRLAAGTMP
jgi:glutamine---fructose-6-phosphate transaminase (isomerizing)